VLAVDKPLPTLMLPYARRCMSDELVHPCRRMPVVVSYHEFADVLICALGRHSVPAIPVRHGC
jgi:hypothetical protein